MTQRMVWGPRRTVPAAASPAVLITEKCTGGPRSARIGLPAPDPEALAETVLSESEARTFDRSGSAREYRASEDTVEPPE
jgi:hypothetical protein